MNLKFKCTKIENHCEDLLQRHPDEVSRHVAHCTSEVGSGTSLSFLFKALTTLMLLGKHLIQTKRDICLSEKWKLSFVIHITSDLPWLSCLAFPSLLLTSRTAY